MTAGPGILSIVGADSPTRSWAPLYVAHRSAELPLPLTLPLLSSFDTSPTLTDRFHGPSESVSSTPPPSSPSLLPSLQLSPARRSPSSSSSARSGTFSASRWDRSRSIMSWPSGRRGSGSPCCREDCRGLSVRSRRSRSCELLCPSHGYDRRCC
jgi:hypothetical protein